MACLLWEQNFYESGVDVGQRIVDLVGQVNEPDVTILAYEARVDHGIRHAPLLVAAAMVKRGYKANIRDLLSRICLRADDPGEFLAILRALNGGTLKTVPRQVKLGLGDAMQRFNRYQLGKYMNRGDYKPLDVLRLCHPKPKDAEQANCWGYLAKGELEAPQTWEVRFASLTDDGEKGKALQKRDIWNSMLEKRELGALALVRNIRNMLEVKVEPDQITDALDDLVDRQLRQVMPWQWVSAAIENPTMEAQIDHAMLRAINMESADKLPGKTMLLVDVSGSMTWGKVSAKSQRDRCDAACGLAIHLREACEQIEVMAFSTGHCPIPARRGMALRDAITQCSVYGGGTDLGRAVAACDGVPAWDRLIVLTDEQSHDRVDQPNAARGYMVNLGTYENGVGYRGRWRHVNGFSAATVDWILASERE